MNVITLANDLLEEAHRRRYISRLEFLEQSTSMLKARLYVSLETFVQVYRNDRFKTTNFVLVHNAQRIYARDELDGVWHRHAADEPEKHDLSAEGQHSATLSMFLDEIEVILGEMNLT